MSKYFPYNFGKQVPTYLETSVKKTNETHPFEAISYENIAL
jgi:hypothetical protein